MAMEYVTSKEGLPIYYSAGYDKVVRTAQNEFKVKIRVGFGSAFSKDEFEQYVDRYGRQPKVRGHITVLNSSARLGVEILLQNAEFSYVGNSSTVECYYTIGSSSSGALTQDVDLDFRWYTANDKKTQHHDLRKVLRLKIQIPAWNPNSGSGTGSGSGSGGSGSGGSGSGGTGSGGGTTSGKTYTVKPRDTLWVIAANHLGYDPNDKSKAPQIQKEVNRLASLNNLKDPNKIYVDQVLNLGTSGGGSSTSSSSVIKIDQFGPLSTDENTLLATWNWSKSNTESYKAHWDYDVGNGIWLTGNHSNITIDEDVPEMAQQSTYSIPSGAVKVRFKVKPIAKKNKDSNGNESYKWTVGWSKEKIWTNQKPLTIPSAPSIKIDGYKLTATLDGIKIDGATSIVFQIVKDNSETSLHTSKPVPIITQHASYSYDVNPGSEYKVRCYAYNDSNKNKSDWSPYSGNEATIPAAPSVPPTVRAESDTSISLTWNEVPTATSYDIEYTTDKNNFDVTKETTTQTGIETTTYKLTGLESGVTYFLRIRAVNDKGNSAWSEIASIIIGTDPAAPTTWSSTTTAIIGEPVALYWVHNTEDGSSQTLAELEMVIGGTTLPAITIKNLTSEDDKDKTRSCEIDTKTGYLRWVEDDGEHEVYLGWIVDRNVKIDTIVNPEGECSEVAGVLTTTGDKVYTYTPASGVPVYCALTNIYTKADVITMPETKFKAVNGVRTTTGEPVYSYIDDSENPAYCVLVGAKCYAVLVSEAWCEVKRDHSSIAAEGAKIQWRVRTAGITNAYGDWSIQRTIDIYAPPKLDLRVTTLHEEEIKTLENFPFMVYALASPETQTPTGYHLEVISNNSYETVDNIGNPKTVNEGDVVYSKFFDVDYRLLVELSAGDIILENNMSYDVKCTVSMNSGLTTVATKEFTVSWLEMEYEPNAEISIDADSYTATIRPYCESTKLVYYKVEYANYKYTKTNLIYDSMYGTIVKKAKTTTGEQVYSGIAPDGYIKGDLVDSPAGELLELEGAFTTDGNQVYSYTDSDDNVSYYTIIDGNCYSVFFGEEIYYCKVLESTPITEVYLSVYRREYDGSFTEIASYLDGNDNTAVIDPHPALDYARYRIVATDMWTGTVSYYDLPGYPVGGNAVIVQWNEDWSDFEAVEDAVIERPPWTGSLLKLPYNIDVSDSHSPDSELVEYIGRSHPVSYYGTHLGTTSSWNMVIPKSDKETLYALRRLARWLGDVYVREPSGSGYWANITVSFSQKHKDVTIPVSFSITRVEGGV